MNDRLISSIADELVSYKRKKKGLKLLKFATTSSNTFQNYQDTGFKSYFSNYITYIFIWFRLCMEFHCHTEKKKKWQIADFCFRGNKEKCHKYHTLLMHYSSESDNAGVFFPVHL